MATPGVFEVFKEAAKQETEEQRAQFLQRYGDHFAIRSILQGCFDPKIKFLLPTGKAPYSEPDGIQVETRLYSLAKRFDIFVEGGRPVASQAKREILFIELLESIHPEDAKILVRMKDKMEPVPGINRRVAALAFPALFPGVDTTKVEDAEPVADAPKTTRKTRARKSTTTVRKPKAKAKPKAKV